MSRFSEKVTNALLWSGWFEGRECPEEIWLQRNLPCFGPARQILSEFGGLKIGDVGPGLECAASDLDLDPAKAKEVVTEPVLQKWCRETGRNIYPLGVAHRGHGQLFVDTSGTIFLYGDDLLSIANTFDEAVEVLLIGRKVHAISLVP